MVQGGVIIEVIKVTCGRWRRFVVQVRSIVAYIDGTGGWVRVA